MKKRLMTVLLIAAVGMMAGCGNGADVKSDNAKAKLEDTKKETETDNVDDENSDEKMENSEMAESGTTDRNGTDNGNVEEADVNETAQDNESMQSNTTVGNDTTTDNSGTDVDSTTNGKAADGETTEGTDSGSQNIYEVCTSLPKAEVEAFAGQVKQQIVSHDWKGLSENISYPITVGDTTYQNSDEFAAGNFSESLSQKFIDAVEAESCTDMFCSWQGIMMGNGEVWISEILNDDASSQGLKVTAINGMVE